MTTTINLKKTFASLPKTTRGKFTVINGDPKGNNFLYCNGQQVYIRNIVDSSICDTYSDHGKETTVAKYSPSGFYIASGDVTGKVRIWDTVNPEHILKSEFPVLADIINDIDWSADSDKICAVGSGKQSFGKVFRFDTGNSLGEIVGHSKLINSVAMKPNRPFRIATCSEDFTTIFYEGPPFKFKCTKHDAQNFVNCVRYSPCGEVFIAGGSEGRMWIYDGKTSDLLGELGDKEAESKAHKGGVYAICFNSDGKKLLSVSGDKTAKIWDREKNVCEKEFVLGKTIADMQVGCLWQGDHLITLSLSGHINYLDPANPSQPKKIIKGHNKPITALAVTEDGSTIYSASSDGLLVEWDATSSNNEEFKGKGHTNQVNELTINGDTLVSIGMDDTVRFSKTASQENGDSVQTDSQPIAADSRNGQTVVLCLKEILIFESSGKKLSSMPITYTPHSCAISPDGTEVLVGSIGRFYKYSLSSGVLSQTGMEEFLERDAMVAAMAFAPDGMHLAVSNSKMVVLYEKTADGWKNIIGNRSSQHMARVTSLAWSPDSNRLMSAALDSYICVWDLNKLSSAKPTVRAHPMSHVNKVRWLNNNTAVTAGQDANLKIWDISE